MKWTEEFGGCWLSDEAADSINRLYSHAQLAAGLRFEKLAFELRQFTEKMTPTVDIERMFPGYSSPFGRLTEDQLVDIRTMFYRRDDEYRAENGRPAGIFTWLPESKIIDRLQTMGPGELAVDLHTGAIVPWRRDRDGMLWLRVKLDQPILEEVA
jgi:hypothetical protein